ncbi:MAG: PaaI family thioesterase [Pseudomonadota bacterium]
MNAMFDSNIADWLKLEALSDKDLYKTAFQTHHLGNIFIRSLHGGVTGAVMEMVSEDVTRQQIEPGSKMMITSSSIDYLRVTKDSDLYARAKIVRLSKRMSVVDVKSWQDDETLPIARGVFTLKIERAD